MPRSARGRSYRPLLEDIERRDVPTSGLAGHVAEALPPPALTVQVQGPRLARAEMVATARGGTIAALRNSDPFAGLAFIDRSSLRPGDILVSTEDARISDAIRTATFSAYSHAALYVGEGKIIDATGKGVLRRDLSALTEPATRVGVLRVNNLTAAQQSAALATARRLVGKSYNYFGLIFGGVVELAPVYRFYRAVTGAPLKVSGSVLGPGYFCSELVIKAYKSAGITIAPEAGDTPGGIINYALNRPLQFQFVGRLATGKV